MALVYGGEPSSARSYFSIYRSKTAVTSSMVPPGSQDNKGSSQSTASISSSTPPIPIKQRKNSSLPTPNHSHEDNPNDIDILGGSGRQALGSELPPTPGDTLPYSSEQTANPIIYGDETEHLLNYLGKGNPRSRLRYLDDKTVIKIRRSIDHPLEMNFPVDIDAFREWNDRWPDIGGFEYSAREQKLIIHTLPKSTHERVVSLFRDQLYDSTKSLRDECIRVDLLTGEGKFSIPLVSIMIDLV